MSWITAIEDLRVMLSDSEVDRLCYRKNVFGKQDGVNLRFRTLEFRRVTNFSNSGNDPLGIWLNGALLPDGSVTLDKTDTGDFIMAVAPANTDTLEASYYYQWFNDAELTQFLRLSSNSLGLSDDFSLIGEGLRPAALSYAMGMAYDKMAVRWSQRLSEGFQLNDSVQKDQYALIATWQTAAKNLKAAAPVQRDDFYSRSGQANIPAASVIIGGVRNPQPGR